MNALDIAEPQVLVFYEVDAHAQWHHRILVRRLREAVWVVEAPNAEIQVADLGAMRILPLARSGQLPAEAAGNHYLFDPVDEATLASLHTTASRMAEVLGGATPPVLDHVGRARWYVADTGLENFGDEIPDDVVNNGATGVVRGAMALVKMGTLWSFAEHVVERELDLWMASKRSGAGRDPRIVGDLRDAKGRRWMSLPEAINSMRPTDFAKVKDWPMKGPRASTEVVTAVRSTGLELNAFHDRWQVKAGIHPDAAIVWEHKCLLFVLALLVNYDQVDISNLAGAEYACRRLLMIERAVKGNPKSPCFAGLHKMIEQSLDESGGLMTVEFTEHIAKLSEAEAKVMKQRRLLKEEMETASKGSKEGEGPPRGQRNRGKNNEAPVKEP
jgi:hypothetical protein